MSGVYISGMKMPKNIEPGLVIEFADGINGKRYARLFHYRYGGLTEWLEAVSVSEHGRLKDYDQIMKEYNEWFNQAESREYESMFYALYRAINDARTIVSSR